MRRALLAVVLALLATACSRDQADSGRLQVVAAFFPLAELARAVGGDEVDVHDLTPSGVEPHDLELSSKEVDRIHDADIVLFFGGGFQPGVEKAMARAEGQSVDLLPAGTRDPHVWLDPVAMAGFVDKVVEALGPEHRARGDAYQRELQQLDGEYRARLATCDRRVLVTTHEAFGHLARRYGLTQEALTGLTPEAEPDPKRLAELADFVKSKGVTTVFTEGSEERTSAEALAREAGVKTAALRTLEFDDGRSYVEDMQANLAVLVDALGCR